MASTPERARAAAANLRVPHADASLAAALDRGIDAVHICAPNALHRELVLEALEHKVHVVCEKPLGITVAEAAELEAAARATGVVHAVCFNNRFYPLVQEIAARRREGLLGARFSSGPPSPTTPSGTTGIGTGASIQQLAAPPL